MIIAAIAGPPRAPVERATPAHHGSPVQPPVGSIAYTRADGTVGGFRMMPFLHEPGDWPATYGSLAEAVGAARGEAAWWGGRVTFGVFAAAEGVMRIRPMESERGLAFSIEREQVPGGASRVQASATDPALQALVSQSMWADLSRPDARTGVEPISFGP